MNCWYQTLNVDEGGSHLESELILDAYWATEPGDPYVEVWHPPGSEGAAITYCSDVDEFRAGLGVTASTDVSVRVTYKFRQAHLPHDAEVGRAAANALRDVVAQYARSCDGVEIIPRSSYVTPLPPYLADAIDALGEVAPAPIPTTIPATEAPVAETTTQALANVATPDAPAPAAPEGSSGLRTLGWVFLGLSVAGLAWTLMRARKERRVRPRFDVIRIVLISSTAIGMTIVLANTPLWAIASGVGLGLILGWSQGRNVSIRLAGKRMYENRNLLAIAAFAVGLVVTQVAGLLNRTGVIGLGVGISFLSAAVASGLLAGRTKPVRAARATALTSVLLGGLLLLGLLPLVALAQEQLADDERRAAIRADLTTAVDWDQIEIGGGLFPFDEKPLAVLAITPGLTEPPAPLIRTVQWTVVPPHFDEETQEWVDGDPAIWRNYDLTETFTFSLTSDGVCCSVAYDAVGTE